MGTMYTLTGDFGDLVGGEGESLSAYIRTNLPDGKALIDTTATANGVRLGTGRVAIDAQGVFSVVLLGTANTGLNVPANTLRYEVVVTYVDRGTGERKTWASGYFPLTADADLKDIVPDVELVPASTYGEQLASRIDGAVNHGDVSGSVTFSGPKVSHRFSATGPTTVTLDEFLDGQVVSLICFSGADDVVIVGAPDTVLVDGTAWAAEYVEPLDLWVTGGGGGAPATPDTTPPSAPTSLNVTPGDDGTTATATFAPGADGESTVKHRYILYPTSGTQPAWPTSGPAYNITAGPIALTGLTPGTAYTMKVQSYSAGGSQATIATAAFTTPTPAGWSMWDSIDFVDQTDGTFASPKDFTTTTSRTLRATSSGNIVVGSDKVKGELTGPEITLSYPSATAPAATRVTIPFDLVGTNASYGPGVKVRLNMTTGKATLTMELNWMTGTSRRMTISADFGSGVVLSGGAGAPGYTFASGYTEGLPTTGVLVLEPVGQVLNAYIDDDHVYAADFTSHTFGGNPELLLGTFNDAHASNDGAIYGITLETFS